MGSPDHELPIRYREFWDVPRMFAVEFDGRTYLFDCAFDAAFDDYREIYDVFILPPHADLERGEWSDLPAIARLAGSIAVLDVGFDRTARASIARSTFDRISWPNPAR